MSPKKEKPNQNEKKEASLMRKEELELRKRQLAAREGMPGFDKNVIELKKRITELEGNS